VVRVHLANSSEQVLDVTLPKFWQNFPRSLSVQSDRIELGLFPRRNAELHELQGGEQKSHEVVVAFAADAVSHTPLAWVHDPVLLYPDAEWNCESGVVPFLLPAADETDPTYRALVASALDDTTGFIAKRERVD